MRCQVVSCAEGSEHAIDLLIGNELLVRINLCEAHYHEARADDPMTDDKVRENRLRRMAHRQQLRLKKSPRRDPHATDYARYWLFDPIAKVIVAGGAWGLDLDAIEQHLKGTGSEP